jgi:O-antigen/teichoic acid export membrane protein
MIKKLVGNSLSSAMVPLLKMGITFFMAPLIVHALGNYDYGVWEIVFSVVGYMGILDLGLAPAIVRFVARHYALGDKEELQRIYSSALAFFFPVGLFLSAGLIACSLWAPQFFFKGPGSGSLKYTIFIMIIGIQIFFTFVGSIFDCYIEGLQRYSLRNYSTIIFSVIGAVIMYPLLKNGGGLLTVAVANAFGYSLKNIIYMILLWQSKYGGYRFRRRNVSKKTLRELFAFGLKNFVYAVSLRISTMTDPLVIGAFLGPAVVPFYVIPVNLLGQARNLIWSATRNFMPVFSELHALSEKNKTQSVFFNSSRYALGIIIPVVTGICILGPSFLAHWMGVEYAEKGVLVIYIMAAAYMTNWLNPFSNRFLTGVGRHGIQARIGIVSSLMNLALSLVLVRFVGKEGVALGTLIPALIFEPYLLYKTCKLLESNIMQYSRQVFLPMAMPTICFILVLLGEGKYLPNRSIIDVVIQATIGMAIYVPVFVMLAMKRKERKNVYGQILGKILPVTKIC